MILTTGDPKRNKEMEEKFKDELIRECIDPVTLRFIRSSEEKEYYGHLNHIIDKALELDREISKQVAQVEWVFDDRQPRSSSRASHREGWTQRASSRGREGVSVIVAPAVLKRGKSSGDNFDEEQELMAPEITVIRELLPTEMHSRYGTA
jgi:hypothetical protein